MDVTIKEAAERLGVSVDTIRRRLKAGELEGRQEPQGKGGFRWLVTLPEIEAQPASAPHDDAPAGSGSAATHELADSRARIEGLERLIDEIARQRDNLEQERDDWKGAARRESEAARELRVLLKGAQESTRALTATLEPQPAPGLPDTAHDARAAPTVAQAATEGAPETWRARFRRWIEG